MAAIPPAYRIETARLVIRCWRPDDAPLLKDAIDSSIDHLRPWMPWVENEPEDLTVKAERLRRFKDEFDFGQNLIYGIFSSDETRVLGGTGLHTRQGPDTFEIGYWIRFDSVQRGFASESTAALARVAFEVDRIQRVEIRCDTRNHASAAIPRKLGFFHEDTFLSDERSTMTWAMRDRDYAASFVAKIPMRAFDILSRPFEIGR